ncbi:MAG: response regulator [Acetobacterales bacterium]
MPRHDLTGRNVLIIEDEYFLAEELATAFRESGAVVVGPVATVSQALAALEDCDSLDAAVLDVNLRGASVYPVADALLERHVPFVFATGYDESELDVRFAEVPHCLKPIDIARVKQALFGRK